MKEIDIKLINDLKIKYLNNQNIFIKEIIANGNLRCQIQIYHDFLSIENLYQEIIQKIQLINDNKNNDLKNIILDLTILLMAFDENKTKVKIK